MLVPDELTHTTDALESLSDNFVQTTEVLERLPRMQDRRSAISERRQNILLQKQTDALPQLTVDTPGTKVAWRQVVQLREENRRLRFELEEYRSELQRLTNDYTMLQAEIEKEVAIIHNGHQQETEHYQNHFQELMEERNNLQDQQFELEQRYQKLYRSFRDSIEEEARKMMTAAAQTAMLTPDKAPVLLQDVVKTLELQVRQEEDKHLIKAMFLKREVTRLAEQLEQERRQIGAERQQLVHMQNSVREQAGIREKALHDRLYARWKVVTISTSIGLLGLLVALQFLCLALFHVVLPVAISLSILAPIVICIVLAIVLANPINIIKHMYTSVPHKKKIQQHV